MSRRVVVGGLSAIAGEWCLLTKGRVVQKCHRPGLEKLKGLGSTILEFLGLSLPKIDLVADLDTSKALASERISGNFCRVRQQKSTVRKGKRSGII